MEKKELNPILKNQKTFSATKAAYRSVSYTLGQTKGSVLWVADLWRQLRKHKRQKVDVAIADGMTPEQRFRVLMNAFRKTKADLPALRRQHAIAFWIWCWGALFFALLAFYGYMNTPVPGIAVGFATIDFSFGGVLRALAIVGCLIQAARAAQSNYIFRHQIDVNFRDFIKSKDWLPS